MPARTAETAAVTIHDVAARAGVSIKTVSRVLNHEPRVTPDTRARVQAAVSELRYTPNPAARNLSSAVTATLGLAFPARAHSSMASGRAYTLGIQAGALSACERLDFGLLLLPCDWSSPTAAPELVRRAQARRVRGVVIASPVDMTPGLLLQLREADIRASVINANDLDGDLPSVAVDDEHAVTGMVGRLVALGHRRIGFVGGLAGTRTSADREAGYRRAMQAAGLPVDPAWITNAGFEFELGRAAGERLLDLQPRPTAIYAANDDMALGVMHAALDRGLQISRDLSVAGFDDTEGASFIWPPLATVRQPLADMAVAAVEQLAAQLYPSRLDLPEQPRCRRFAAELLARGSIGPAPA